MINQFPDSTLVPRAKQKLRDVQEVLAERETQIGLFYVSREQFSRHCPAGDRSRHLPALFQERPGAAGHRRCLSRRGPGHRKIPHLPAKIKERHARGLPGQGRRGFTPK
jgi:hypothetical protein